LPNEQGILPLSSARPGPKVEGNLEVDSGATPQRRT